MKLKDIRTAILFRSISPGRSSPTPPDAWIDEKKTKVGYEIPMTRYFYEYQPPEPVEDIMARITVLEQEISESLRALFHKNE